MRSCSFLRPFSAAILDLIASGFTPRFDLELDFEPEPLFELDPDFELDFELDPDLELEPDLELDFELEPDFDSLEPLSGSGGFVVVVV